MTSVELLTYMFLCTVTGKLAERIWEGSCAVQC